MKGIDQVISGEYVKYLFSSFLIVHYISLLIKTSISMIKLYFILMQ
jgi:hypothetical protein